MRKWWHRPYLKLINKRLALCEILNDLGYITDLELMIEGEYNKRTVKPAYCLIYRLSILPLSLLVRMFPKALGSFANYMVRRIWLDKAVKTMIEDEVRQ